MMLKSVLFNMKISALILFLISGSIASAQVYHNQQAQKRVKNSEIVRVDSSTHRIVHIKYSEGVSVKPDSQSVTKYLTSTLSIPRGFTFKTHAVKVDRYGYQHVKSTQFYKGISVYGAVYNLHYKGSALIGANGFYCDGVMPSNIPTITYQDAFNRAALAVGADKYKWEVDETIPVSSLGELIYLPTDSGKVFLTYRFDIYSIKPLSRKYVFVDAHSGRVLKTLDRIHHSDISGLASTMYNGEKTIATSYNGSTYLLRETGRCGITTYDLNQQMNYGSAVDFTDSDNHWTTTTNYDNAALDAHYGTEVTYDYYKNIHLRNSYDDKGSSLISYVHFGTNYSNAFWDGQSMTYGDGDNLSTSPFTSLDIVAHEITHGVTEHSASLEYSYESGALNESFSDIFGLCVDFYANPGIANWEMGELIHLNGGAIRSMSNPNLYFQPDTYHGNYWHTGYDDNGGVHYNSGVQNFWFYLLVNGGAGTNDLSNNYQVEGIGIDAAAAIAYRNLTTYLTPTSNYLDAREYSIQSAIDIYGACSDEVMAVTNAWHAVGVGDAFNNVLTAQFSADYSYSCKAPADIRFMYTGTNASEFAWNFGDGNSSDLKNPLHTYTEAGTYTVMLSVKGNATCGDLSANEIKNNMVQVSTIGSPVEADCQPQTIYPGNLGIYRFTLGEIDSYSNGSSEGNRDMSCRMMTHLTEGGKYSIKINGSENALQWTAVWIDLNNDGAFDSNTERIFSIDSHQGSIMDSVLIPSSFVTNVPLRLRVGCDQYTQPINSCQAVSGQFEDYSVIIDANTDKPETFFTPSKTVLVSGESVIFNDQSLHLPTSWKWTFIGGTPSVSNLQNPTVVYHETGSYDVKLVTTNEFGNDSVTREGIINVSDQYLMCHDSQSGLMQGLLYDDGGPNGTYSNNVNCSFLIAPDCAKTITLSFSQIDMERCCDAISIYDGEDMTGTLLATSSGNTIPGNVVAHSGKMFIIFKTDNSVVGAGFAAQWNCTPLDEDDTPQAEINVSSNSPYFGEDIYLADVSLGRYSKRKWYLDGVSFSDSEFTSLKMSSPGEHTIKLVVGNCIGKDSTITILSVANAPEMTLSTDLLEANLYTDEVRTLDFTISNTNGTGPLVLEMKKNKDGSQSVPSNSMLNGVNILICRGNSMNDAFKNALIGRGATVSEVKYASPSVNQINSAEIIIVDGTMLQSYSANIRQNIQDWKDAGGNLFLFFPYAGNDAYSNQLLQGTGISVGSSISYYEGLITSFAEHSITRDLSSIYVQSYYQSMTLSSGAEFIMDDPSGRHLIAVSSTNHGRVVVSTCNLFLDDIVNTHPQNLQMANQAVNWLLQDTWYSIVSNQNVVVNAGESTSVLVRMDATALFGGTYTGNIEIKSNDPSKSMVLLPVRMNVTGVPQIVVDKSAVDFKDAYIGFHTDASLLIQNTGTDLLSVTGFNFSDNHFSTAITQLNIEPQHSALLPIMFSPDVDGEIVGTLTLVSNDLVRGDQIVALSGTALIPPVIGLSLDTVRVSLYSGDTGSASFELSNSGGSDLIYSLDNPDVYSVESLSSQTITTTGQTTQHPFSGIPSKIESVTVKVTLNGDYTDADFEYADLVIEGINLGHINRIDVEDGNDIVREYQLSGTTLQTWLIDGRLDIQVVNNQEVNPGYGQSINKVSLTYKTNSWVSVSPTHGHLNAGQATSIEATIDSHGLKAGKSIGKFYVRSNDPYNPMDSVVVELTVLPASRIKTNAQSFSFGSVFIDQVETHQLEVSNFGCDPLMVTNIVIDNNDFMIDKPIFSVLPGKTEVVEISFSPSTIGNFMTSMVIFSNDKLSPQYEVGLSGRGIQSPIVEINPTYYSLTMSQGEIVTLPITISNEGLGILDFEYKDQSTVNDSTSVIAYSTYYASTLHNFTKLATSFDSLYVTVTINGNFSDSYKTATLYIENQNFDVINTIGVPDGTDFVRTYRFDAATAANWLSDGRLSISVANNYNVNLGLGKDEHTVRVKTVRHNWCYPLTSSGRLNSGRTFTTAINFDATSLSVGQHRTNLMYATNDPLQPLATIPVLVNVLSGNRPPVMINSLSDLYLNLSQMPYSINLNNYFTDPEGKDLIYSVSRSNNGALSASISGDELLLTTSRNCNETITVYVFDADGAQISSSFIVNVSNKTAIDLNNAEPGIGIYNVPNPFSAQTVIYYSLDLSGHVKVSIFSSDGREVLILLDETQASGSHQLELLGSQLKPGIYFCKIVDSNGRVLSHKIVKY